MSKKTLSDLSIIAIHYSTDEILKGFIEKMSFINEVIIIDATCTAQIQNPNIQILQSTTESIQLLMAKAKSLIKYNWILEIKTTYYISDSLESEIRDAIQQNEISSFYIGRNFFFFDKKVNFGALETRRLCCLYNKFIPGKPKYGRLKQKITNNSYQDFDAYNTALTVENDYNARELFANHVKPNYYHFLLKPLLFFNYHYFLRGGFLNGKKGFVLVYIHSFAVLKKYLQLWLKHKNLN